MEEDKNSDENEYEADFDLEDEEEFLIEDKGGSNPDDDAFDEIVGCLQEIILSDKYETLQTNFFKKNYSIFTDEDENKLEYTQIYFQYKKKFEKYIMKVRNFWSLCNDLVNIHVINTRGRMKQYESVSRWTSAVEKYEIFESVPVSGSANQVWTFPF